MKINAEKQQGQVVWARMSQKSKMWAAIILSVKKMNLPCFKDRPGKTCVWWLSDNTMSQLNNDLIFEFKSYMKYGLVSLDKPRKKNIKQAIRLLSIQLNFVVPEHRKIIWASTNLPVLLINGKYRKKKEYFIPDEFLQKIIMANNNIKRNMENKIKNDAKTQLKKKKKIDVSQISKKQYRYCMACRLPSDKLEIEHPIFKGFLCNNCFINGKDIILSIAKDQANDGCCVCLTQKETLILCSFCVRAYCNECLEFYCGQKAVGKILDEITWSCFACNITTSNTSKLVSRSTKEQLKNIYNLYPANTVKNYAKEQIQELHVMNLKDIQNNVPKALQSLGFPFKILETSYLNDNIEDNNENIAKLVIQYYPNKEDYNKDKFFDLNDCIKKLFSFLQIKNKMEALQKDGKPIFWAFETSAAIKIVEQKTISRFLNIQPIIIGMETNDVQQRSRLIWTNITILNENIKQLTNQNIYLHKIPKYVGRRSKFYKDNIADKPWCYTSIYAILSSFIKNDIVF